MATEPFTSAAQLLFCELTQTLERRKITMPEYVQGAQELLPDGHAWFAVDDAGEKESKTGKAMIELQLLCYVDDPAKAIRVFDRLVFDPNSFWKIDAFRVCTGEKLVEGQKCS